MKRFLPLALILISCSAFGRDRIAGRDTTQVALVAADAPAPLGPVTGNPMSFLRPLSPTGHLTIRINTTPEAPWGNTTWVNTHRISGGNIVVYVWRATSQDHYCLAGQFTVPAAPNQQVDFDLNLASFADSDILMLENWPGYVTHIMTTGSSYGRNDFPIVPITFNHLTRGPVGFPCQ